MSQRGPRHWLRHVQVQPVAAVPDTCDAPELQLAMVQSREHVGPLKPARHTAQPPAACTPGGHCEQSLPVYLLTHWHSQLLSGSLGMPVVIPFTPLARLLQSAVGWQGRMHVPLTIVNPALQVTQPDALM